MKSVALRWLAKAALAAASGFVTIASSQTPPVLLLPYQAVWKYDDSGTDLGTAWREIGFNDADWKSGPGVFLAIRSGTENLHSTAVLQGAQINTTLNRTNSAGNAQVRTYYFRTPFTLQSPPPNTAVVLWSSNLVDDGAVFYLNGQEVRRGHMPTGMIAHATFAASAVEVSRAGDPDTLNDGGYYELMLASSNLVAGENLLAVEVHDVGSTSAEVVFGLSLGRFTAGLPTIVTQPENLTVEEDNPFTLSVAVSSELPVTYQWQKADGAGGFTNLVNALGPTYPVPRAMAAHAGAYRVLVANLAGTVTSETAQVEVVRDVTGPTIVSAIAEPALPHQIIVTFSERVWITPAIVRENYQITEVGTGQSLTISNAQWQNTIVRLLVSPWNPASQYVLTVNNLRDLSPNRNIIAPHSQVGIGFASVQPLLAMDHWWRWTDQGWDLGAAWRTNGLEGTLYGEGQGIFYSVGYPAYDLCGGQLNTLISVGPTTHYFATEFVVPEVESIATLESTILADDGYVAYLNGVEFGRFNLPPAPACIGYDTLASNSITSTACVTNAFSVSNLLSGSNRLAVEVHQAGRGDPDVIFGLRLTGRLILRSDWPGPPVPRLHLDRQDEQFSLRWTGGGYALESAPQFDGPWQEVQPDMANPYLTAATNGATRFWRLKNKQPMPLP